MDYLFLLGLLEVRMAKDIIDEIKWWHIIIIIFGLSLFHSQLMSLFNINIFGKSIENNYGGVVMVVFFVVVLLLFSRRRS